MRAEIASITAKAVATAGVAAAAYGLTWWAVAAALIGSAVSYHFEPEQRPKRALNLAFGIFAMGFAAAFTAVAIPHVPLFGWSVDVPIEVRAGLLGLFIRVLIEKGKQRIFGAKAEGG